jgi:transposase
MSKSNFSDEFKRDAVRQITERGYPVSEVSQRLGVSQHSLYEWKKKVSSMPGGQGSDQSEEIRQLKRELATALRPIDECRFLSSPLQELRGAGGVIHSLKIRRVHFPTAERRAAIMIISAHRSDKHNP